jgi:hypothetical protein
MGVLLLLCMKFVVCDVYYSVSQEPLLFRPLNFGSMFMSVMLRSDRNQVIWCMLRYSSVGVDLKGVKNMIWVLDDREFIHDFKNIIYS